MDDLIPVVDAPCIHRLQHARPPNYVQAVKPLIVDVETAGAAHRRLLRSDAIQDGVVDVDAEIGLRTRPDRLIERYRRAQHPQQLPHYAPYNKKQASSFLS
jgi:hypothetical protein